MFKKTAITIGLMVIAFHAQAQDNNTMTTTPNPMPATTTDSNGVTTSVPNTSNGTVVTPSTDTVTTTPGVTTTTTPTPGVTTTTTPTPVATTPAPVSTSTTSQATTTSTTTATAQPSGFVCVGNMPGWNLTISKSLITYANSKDPSVKIKGITPTTTGDVSGNLQAFTAKDNNNRNVTILINRNSNGCSNGLAGQSYGYDAFIVFSNQVLVGCCNPQ